MVSVTCEGREISSHLSASTPRGSAVWVMVKTQCGNPVLLINSLPPVTSSSTSLPVSPPGFLTLRPLELFSHTVISRSRVQPGMCRAWRKKNNMTSHGKGKAWRELGGGGGGRRIIFFPLYISAGGLASKSARRQEEGSRLCHSASRGLALHA